MATKYANGNYTWVFGTSYDDRLYNFWNSGVRMAGGAGNDYLFNEGIYSSLFGDDGRDTIVSSGDYTYIDGGSGDDVVSLAPYTNRATLTYFDGDGNDTIYGFNPNIILDIRANWSSSIRSGNDAIIRVGSGSIKIVGGGSLVSSNLNYGVLRDSVKISGTSGADFISNQNAKQNVTIIGGAGNDSIQNKGNNASISGGAGNDYIQNDSNSKTRIDAGNDNDKIRSTSSKYSTIIGGAGNDSISDSKGTSNSIVGDAGNDTVLVSQSTSNTIVGGAGKDYIQSTSDNKIRIDAGNDNDKIRSTSSKYSTIIGGAGNDSISDSKGTSNSIVGGAGHDTIVVSQSSNNIISGGAGNDVISLNASNSKNTTINYSKGDGNDTIYGFGTDDVFNIKSTVVSSSVKSGASIIISNYSSVKSGSDIILTIGTGKVTFKNAAGKSLNISPFKTYKPTKNQASILASNRDDSIASGNYNRITLNGGSGNDTISISSASVTAIGGAGNDSILASTSSKNVSISAGDGKDTISVSGQNITILGGAGDDSIFTNNTSAQKIKINAGAGIDSLKIGGQNVSVAAGDGNDVVSIYSSTAKNISIDGGKGKDSISVTGINVTANGGADDDSIRINANSNNVKINAGDGNDKIYAYAGKNITISGGNGADSVSISSSASNVSISGGAGNDTIRNASSKSRIDGGAGVDRIYNTASSVSIDGGAGNDLISISSSAKNVVINYNAKSGGNDTIYGFNSDDRINVTGGKISSSVRSGANAILTIGSGKITLVGGAPIVKNNVSVKSANSRINGTAYADSIYNGGYNRATINAGAGNDTIYNRDGDYASIVAGDGNDYIALHSVDSSKIDGGAGNDSIFMNYGGKNTITGGLGNDLISIASNSQNVTINYAEGDGNDRIYGFRSRDRLNITSGGISSSVKSGNNAILTVGTGKITLFGAASLIPNVIEVQREFSVVNGTSKNDWIFNNDAHNYVTINAGAGNDIVKIKLASHMSIDAGTGDDLVSLWSSYDANVNAGDGNDTIITERASSNPSLAGGKGNDVISLDSESKNVTINYTTGDGNDTIYGFKDEEVTLNINGSISSSVQSGKNAVLTVGNGKITIVDFNITNKRVKASWEVLNGTAQADSILNDSGNSDLPFSYVTINSGDGNDTIYNKLGDHCSINAGTGNDSINLFNSIDTTVDAGDGNDTILSLLGFNSLVGGKGSDVISLGNYNSSATIGYADGDGNDTIYGFNTGGYFNSVFDITSGSVSSSVRSGTTLTLTIGSGRVTFLNIDPNANLDIRRSGSVTNSSRKIVDSTSYFSDETVIGSSSDDVLAANSTSSTLWGNLKNSYSDNPVGFDSENISIQTESSTGVVNLSDNTVDEVTRSFADSGLILATDSSSLNLIGSDLTQSYFSSLTSDSANRSF